MMGALTTAIGRYGFFGPYRDADPEAGFGRFLRAYSKASGSCPAGNGAVPNARKLMRQGGVVAVARYTDNPGVVVWGPLDRSMRKACEEAFGPRGYGVSRVDVDEPQGVPCTVVRTGRRGVYMKAKELGL